MSLFHHVKRHYHQHYRSKFAERAHWVFLFDSALVAVILSLLGLGLYFAFFYHPLRDDFRISLTAEKPLVAGEDDALIVHVTNTGKRRLDGAVLAVYLPKEFHVESFPDGYAPERQEIDIGTMPAKASADFRFRGFPVGPAATIRAYAQMTATASDGEHDEKVVETDLSWKQNLVETSLSLPDSVVGGQPIHLSISVKNGSRKRFETVLIQPTWPANFRLTTSSPPTRDGAVSVGPLGPGETVTADFGGRVAVGGFDYDVPVDIWWITPEGEKLLLSQTSQAGTAYAAGLKFSATISNHDPFLVPGADVPVTIDYQNAGTAALKDLKFSLPLDPGVTDAANSKAVFDPIAELKPGETGSVTGTIRLKKAFSKYVTNAKLTLTPVARFSAEGPGLSGVTVAAETVETKIEGQTTMLADARYFTAEGEQIGRGPLPPKIGKQTRYWASTIVSVGTSDVTGAVVRIPLPADVVWTGKAAVSDGDQPTLEGGVLVWRVGDISAHAGATSSAPSASFELGVTPASSALPNLTQMSTLTATDSWTGQTLTSTAPAVPAPTK